MEDTATTLQLPVPALSDDARDVINFLRDELAEGKQMYAGGLRKQSKILGRSFDDAQLAAVAYWELWLILNQMEPQDRLPALDLFLDRAARGQIDGRTYAQDCGCLFGTLSAVAREWEGNAGHMSQVCALSLIEHAEELGLSPDESRYAVRNEHLLVGEIFAYPIRPAWDEDIPADDVSWSERYKSILVSAVTRVRDELEQMPAEYWSWEGE